MLQNKTIQLKHFIYIYIDIYIFIYIQIKKDRERQSYNTFISKYISIFFVEFTDYSDKPTGELFTHDYTISVAIITFAFLIAKKIKAEEEKIKIKKKKKRQVVSSAKGVRSSVC